MPITFRHDSAAIGTPSGNGGGGGGKYGLRNLGQNLVLQQNQQKYQGQQAGYERQFQLGRDIQQNQWKFIADTQDAVNRANLQGQQNQFLDQQQQKRLQAADFEAARNRLDTHAKDMLASGEITDPETRRKIQNLIAGKTIVMGQGFDETARKNYLDQYGSELAKVLSDAPKNTIPPDEPVTKYNQETDTWFMKTPKGWVVSPHQPQREQQPSSQGSKSQQGQQPHRPTSVEEAYQADPKGFDTILNHEIDAQSGANKGKLTPEGLDKARERAWNQYGKQLGLGTPTPAPEIPSQPLTTPQASTPVIPATSQSILEPAATPPTPKNSSLEELQKIWGINQATPPSVIPGGQQAVPSATQPIVPPDASAAQPLTPTGGGRPYTYNDLSQATGDQQANTGVPQTTPSPVAPAANAQPSPMPPTAPPQPSSNKPPAAPDFNSLVSKAEDDTDRNVLSKLQNIYATAKPEVQSAISILINPGTTDSQRSLAAQYLRDAGIDLTKLAGFQTPTDRLYEYQNNLTTTMR